MSEERTAQAEQKEGRWPIYIIIVFRHVGDEVLVTSAHLSCSGIVERDRRLK